MGNVTFLGRTVVSTITHGSSDGLITLVLVATDRLSWISVASRFSPMRFRQRVNDERVEHQPVMEELPATEVLVIGFSTARTAPLRRGRRCA